MSKKSLDFYAHPYEINIYESEQNFLELDKFYSSQNLFQFSFAGVAFLLVGTLVEIETKQHHARFVHEAHHQHYWHSDMRKYRTNSAHEPMSATSIWISRD